MSGVILCCPVCGFEYIHPLSISVITKPITTTIDSKGTRIYPTTKEQMKNLGKGVRIEMEYYCENGHHGKIIFQFHKGQTFMEYEELPQINDWEVIWRE